MKNRTIDDVLIKMKKQITTSSSKISFSKISSSQKFLFLVVEKNEIIKHLFTTKKIVIEIIIFLHETSKCYIKEINLSTSIHQIFFNRYFVVAIKRFIFKKICRRRKLCRFEKIR